MHKKNKTALIMVDLQNDFCPGGSLAVHCGDEVIEVANQIQAHFDLVVATQDWHPPHHMSFASLHAGKQIGDRITVGGIAQILWPDHCVQETHGADFHPHLQKSRVQHIVYKGTDPLVDSYSAFFDNAQTHATGLGDYLHAQGARDVYILGLATDYCVKYSCLDAIKLNFNVYLIEEGCRGVELTPGDIDRAKSEMVKAGVSIVSSLSQLATKNFN